MGEEGRKKRNKGGRNERRRRRDKAYLVAGASERRSNLTVSKRGDVEAIVEGIIVFPFCHHKEYHLYNYYVV